MIQKLFDYTSYYTIQIIYYAKLNRELIMYKHKGQKYFQR